MKPLAYAAPLLAFSLLLAGCQKTDAPAAPADAPAETAAPADADADGAPADAAATASEPAAADEAAAEGAVPPPAAPAPAFDVANLPVSDAKLGEFPYFALPAGYQAANGKPVEMDYTRFPFWTGKRLEWVEGRSHESRIEAAPGKTYSEFELRKNIETLLAGVGAVKVTSSKIPREQLDTLGDEITQGHIDGLGDVWNEPVEVFVLRRADRNIWVHFTADNASGSWLILETAAFQPSARLVDAGAMKRQLDADGKVALHVNFATDSTTIEADSMPQVDQVVKLLQDDPSLRLSIDGHTDNTGGAQHNRTLSEGRAQAVVGTLVARGIDAARLQAQGYGDSRPVADNATESGRAENRRVELVKR